MYLYMRIYVHVLYVCMCARERERVCVCMGTYVRESTSNLPHCTLPFLVHKNFSISISISLSFSFSLRMCRVVVNCMSIPVPAACKQ
jgi:hypothetical protein